MCGRFTQHHDANALTLRFDLTGMPPEITPRYNIAPQQTIGAITVTDTGRRLEGFQWGLIPSWAKDPAIGQKMINARSETLAEKPSFRTALVRRRCLIPADGFYEWLRRGDGSRDPVHFRLLGAEAFAFAGLWEEWHNPETNTPLQRNAPEGTALRTCTIITTSANNTVGRVHDRMPVILTRDAESLWLDDTVRDTDRLRALLKPYPDDAMESFAVSRCVNSVKNEGVELLATENATA